MKKFLWLLIFLGLGIFEAPEVQAKKSSNGTTVSTNSSEGFWKKRRRNRQRKGFMWGLFRKNNCGCPKH